MKFKIDLFLNKTVYFIPKYTHACTIAFKIVSLTYRIQFDPSIFFELIGCKLLSKLYL